jgi:hypothetical protein|tara:strand:+ start:421 stop:537 length:117 start_codon:yes stop_codon:yes gene_type:complete
VNANDGRVVPLLPEQREEIVVGESIVIITITSLQNVGK